MKWLAFILVVGHGGQSWVPLDQDFASRDACMDYIQSSEWIAVLDPATPIYVECREA